MTLSNRGYIKRVATDTYRQQHRGGRGIIGMVTRETDAVRRMTIASTHQNLLFFTDRGRVFRLKCYQIPRETSRTAKGLPIVNLLSIDVKERVTAIITAPESVEDMFMVVRFSGRSSLNVEPTICFTLPLCRSIQGLNFMIQLAISLKTL